MMSEVEATAIMLVAVGFVVLVLTGRDKPQATVESLDPVATEDDPDYWTTPLYLRYNVPVVQGEAYVLPSNRYASWSMGIPQPQATLPKG